MTQEWHYLPEEVVPHGTTEDEFYLEAAMTIFSDGTVRMVSVWATGRNTAGWRVQDKSAAWSNMWMEVGVVKYIPFTDQTNLDREDRQFWVSHKITEILADWSDRYPYKPDPVPVDDGEDATP